MSTPMLTSRAKRIVWGVLLGGTISEGAILVFYFGANGNWLSALSHYTLTPLGTPHAWYLAAGITALYVLFATTRSTIISRHAFQPWRWPPYLGIGLIAIPMALVSGVFEEVFFRRALMDIIMQRGGGAVLQIVISAVAFGAAHAVWGIFARSFRGALSAMLATGLLGAILAITYLIGDRSLAPCAASHIAINLVLEPWLIITAVTGSWGKPFSAAGVPS